MYSLENTLIQEMNDVSSGPDLCIAHWLSRQNNTENKDANIVRLQCKYWLHKFYN